MGDGGWGGVGGGWAFGPGFHPHHHRKVSKESGPVPNKNMRDYDFSYLSVTQLTNIPSFRKQSHHKNTLDIHIAPSRAFSPKGLIPGASSQVLSTEPGGVFTSQLINPTTTLHFITTWEKILLLRNILLALVLSVANRVAMNSFPSRVDKNSCGAHTGAWSCWVPWFFKTVFLCVVLELAL